MQDSYILKINLWWPLLRGRPQQTTGGASTALGGLIRLRRVQCATRLPPSLRCPRQTPEPYLLIAVLSSVPIFRVGTYPTGSSHHGIARDGMGRDKVRTLRYGPSGDFTRRFRRHCDMTGIHRTGLSRRETASMVLHGTGFYGTQKRRFSTRRN